jgi:membrane protease YdiL (CAAX protease family)
VLLVFAAFFLAGIVGAGLLLADRYKNPFQNGSWSDYVPGIIDLVAQTGLAIAVVMLLAARRGVAAQTLGLTLPRAVDGRLAAGRAARILAWAVFAQVLGGIINAALQTGHLPTSKPNAPELIFAVTDSIQAGIVEELVVLAFVVVTLRQAGRAWWEVAMVALVLRASYHIYYGPGVVGILVWAALFYWIYLRTRSLILLMVCHAAWDTVGFLSQRWTAVAGFAVLAAVAIWIAAPITWLIERNHAVPGAASASGQAPTVGPSAWQQVSPPGWHPDPAGLHYWRWWDGRSWTEYVSGP